MFCTVLIKSSIQAVRGIATTVYQNIHIVFNRILYLLMFEELKSEWHTRLEILHFSR
jgi:hypothetical protein